MKITPYSEDLFSVFQRAGNQSKKYYQTFCGTPHLFLSMFAFLATHKDSERYSDTYNTLKTILNSHNVNGSSFEKTFLDYCPKGEAPAEGETFTINTDREYTAVAETLKRRAVAEKRSMEIEDLVLELFADNSFTIRDIFNALTGSETETEKMYQEVVKTFKVVAVPEIEELEQMEGILTNLNKWVKDNPRTVIGADSKVQKIEMGLSGRTLKNVVLLGPAGTGKTEFVYEFVQRIVKGNVPSQFEDRVVYQLDPSALIAGTRYRGDMEERLTNLLEILKSHKNVILFIDEIHTLMSLGSGSDGSQSVGNLIKPYMTRGEISIIGATTSEEYTKYILPDKAFSSRLFEIRIQEPSNDEVREILKGLLPVETEYFKKDIQLELVDKVIELANKYTINDANPRKSIKMLELACAHAAVFEQDKTEVDVDNIIEAVKLSYNTYISKDKLEDTRKELFKTLLGQEKPLNQILRDLKLVDMGVVDLDRPLYSVLLAGPSGTGKTEACKIIAKNYFGSEENLIKIECGSLSDQTASNQLTGSSAGYVGYDDEPFLIKAIRERPNSLVLFDEWEKCHKDVQKVLLNILDTGEMKDNKGNRVSFKNAIIVFTTNLGCNKDTNKATGSGLIKTVKDTSNQIEKAIQDFMSPEFLGRLDDIVYYNPLTDDIYNTLINRYLDDYNNRANMSISFDESDLEKIKKESKIETQGARGLRKAVRKQICEVVIRNEEVNCATDF